MPAFYIIVFISIVFVFFLLSGLYKPIGKWIKRIIKDADEAINEIDEKEKTE